MARTPIALSVGRKHPNRSLRTTLFFEAFSLLTITVILTAVIAFVLAGKELRTRTVAELQSAVHARDNFLETTIARQREQIGILAHDPSLTSLSSVTNLIGFRQLIKIDTNGNRIPVTGSMDVSDSEETWSWVITETAASGFHPLFTDKGWSAYAVTSPQVDKRGVRTGTLVALFDPTDVMTNIFATDFLGQSTEVLLATSHAGMRTILHTDGKGGAVPVDAGIDREDSLIQKTLRDQEGVTSGISYNGIPVLAAYRTMPSLGWMIIVQMDEHEITAPIVRLALNLIGIGLMLVCLLSLSVFMLAKRIVSPLEELAGKLNGLETRHWRFRRSIFTGNELEIVDRAATDLTGRLRQTYDHLEDLVRVRTRELEKKYAEDEAILENVEYGLLMTDDNGLVVYVNRAAELLTGLQASGIVGHAAADLLPLMDKKKNPVPSSEHPVTMALRTKEHWSPLIDPEFSLTKKDGTSTAIFIRSTPILHGTQCQGVVIVLRDTTEERRIDHMKSEFITLVSHQLRTPLSSMRWYLEMLLGEEAAGMSEDQQGYVQELALSNTRMVHLVNALLNVSRLELGGAQSTPEHVVIHDLIKGISDSFKLELTRRKMEIHTTMSDASLALETDVSLLQLIVENLLSNAVKYGKEGSAVTIDVGTETDRSALTIRVSDEGIGIPEAQQAQIFQKMFRGSNARATDTDGNGLGLYISRIAAETIGATLTFASTEGKGTTFILTLPLGDRR